MKARLPQGYGKGANMQNMMKQAQKMQEEMQLKQAELEEKEFSATSGGGVVTVTVTGAKQLTKVEIKPEIVDPDDVEMLQDLIMAAANEALRTAEEVTAAEMSKITSAMNLPGIF